MWEGFARLLYFLKLILSDRSEQVTSPIPHSNDGNEASCTKLHVCKAFLSRSFFGGQDAGVAEALQAAVREGSKPFMHRAWMIYGMDLLNGFRIRPWHFFTSIDP